MSTLDFKSTIGVAIAGSIAGILLLITFITLCLAVSKRNKIIANIQTRNDKLIYILKERVEKIADETLKVQLLRKVENVAAKNNAIGTISGAAAANQETTNPSSTPSEGSPDKSEESITTPTSPLPGEEEKSISTSFSEEPSPSKSNPVGEEPEKSDSESEESGKKSSKEDKSKPSKSTPSFFRDLKNIIFVEIELIWINRKVPKEKVPSDDKNCRTSSSKQSPSPSKTEDQPQPTFSKS